MYVNLLWYIDYLLPNRIIPSECRHLPILVPMQHPGNCSPLFRCVCMCVKGVAWTPPGGDPFVLRDACQGCPRLGTAPAGPEGMETVCPGPAAGRTVLRPVQRHAPSPSLPERTISDQPIVTGVGRRGLGLVWKRPIYLCGQEEGN